MRTTSGRGWQASRCAQPSRTSRPVDARQHSCRYTCDDGRLTFCFVKRQACSRAERPVGAPRIPLFAPRQLRPRFFLRQVPRSVATASCLTDLQRIHGTLDPGQWAGAAPRPQGGRVGGLGQSAVLASRIGPRALGYRRGTAARGLMLTADEIRCGPPPGWLAMLHHPSATMDSLYRMIDPLPARSCRSALRREYVTSPPGRRRRARHGADDVAHTAVESTPGVVRVPITIHLRAAVRVASPLRCPCTTVARAPPGPTARSVDIFSPAPFSGAQSRGRCGRASAVARAAHGQYQPAARARRRQQVARCCTCRSHPRPVGRPRSWRVLRRQSRCAACGTARRARPAPACLRSRCPAG